MLFRSEASGPRLRNRPRKRRNARPTEVERALWALGTGVPAATTYLPSFRRCTRVRRSILRCFFFDMRLRRFLMTEPIGSTSLFVD